MKQKDLLSKLDSEAIVAAVGRAERACSGEVRVHVQRKSRGDIREAAERTFERLGMTKTAGRNGVLLFICSEEQRFVILGDSGINEAVGGDGYWKAIASRLGERFRAGEFTEGIVEAIEQVGEQLRCHFPWQEGDVDELSNEISIDGEGDEPRRE
jgi:uncharacterized membrane protein